MPSAPHMHAHVQSAGFQHAAHFHAGEQEFVASTLPFLRDGAARGEPTLVVVAPRKIALLREALGDDARHVRFEDMTRVGANPGRIIPAWRAFVREADAEERPLRGVGEPISADRSASELFECHRSESLTNLAFAGARDFSLLCAYDTAALDPSVVAHARRTHPFVLEDDGARTSAQYLGLDAAIAPVRAPLPPPPEEAQVIAIMPAGLMSLRAAVGRRAARAGLAPTRGEDLVLAVDELATNSIRHGGGAGTLLMWETATALVCEVTDAGRLENPLAGRQLPEPGQVGRYGLWLVNQLCDLVEQRTLPRGNVVRVTMRRDG